MLAFSASAWKHEPAACTTCGHSCKSFWRPSLNVQDRDLRYVVPFLVQFGLYVSSLGFSSAIVPAKWQLLYTLNPMVGVIEGFRQFRRMETRFADVI